MNIIILTLSLFICAPTQPARAESSPADNAVGTIASLTGAALVRAGAQTANGVAPAHRVIVNEPIANGDVITTGAESTVKILFNDNSIMDLGPASMFKVDQFKGDNAGNRVAYFTLLYGRLRALVTKATSSQSRLQIRTPDAVMGVRGTEFVVSAPANFQRAMTGTASQTSVRTEMTVLSGSVGVTVPRVVGGEVMVTAGSQIVAQSGLNTPPVPQVLNQMQLAQVTQTAKVADNTFDRTVSVDAGTKNENAPPAATSSHAAVATVSTAGQAALNSDVPTPTKGVGMFGALDILSTAPVALLPGNLQTVTVTLSH